MVYSTKCNTLKSLCFFLQRAPEWPWKHCPVCWHWTAVCSEWPRAVHGPAALQDFHRRQDPSHFCLLDPSSPAWQGFVLGSWLLSDLLHGLQSPEDSVAPVAELWFPCPLWHSTQSFQHCTIMSWASQRVFPSVVTGILFFFFNRSFLLLFRSVSFWRKKNPSPCVPRSWVALPNTRLDVPFAICQVLAILNVPWCCIDRMFDNFLQMHYFWLELWSLNQ